MGVRPTFEIPELANGPVAFEGKRVIKAVLTTRSGKKKEYQFLLAEENISLYHNKQHYPGEVVKKR